MGKAIAAAIAAADDLQLAGTWDRGGDLAALLSSSDVLVDFTLPAATDTVIATALRHKVPLVCGVSGLSVGHMQALQRASGSIAIVYDRNMSLGIAVLENLVREAARALPGFDVEVRETHHIHKIDAPSGTALKLGEAIASARGTDPAEIPYESERRGEVPGDHEVVLSSATERLTLAHSVTTRQVFADGALVAARWVRDKSPGLFTMHDVLE
jgi:4-hydroxy-tetrahydrodipicolinate reductase